jgi:hypothetical protein
VDQRRTRFATPFVLVAAAGCGGHNHSNPPPPAYMTVAECKAVKIGSPCTYDYGACSVAPEDPDCGLRGYECKETMPNKFVWAAKVVPCDAQPEPEAEE